MYNQNDFPPTSICENFFHSPQIRSFFPLCGGQGLPSPVTGCDRPFLSINQEATAWRSPVLSLGLRVMQRWLPVFVMKNLNVASLHPCSTAITPRVWVRHPFIRVAHQCKHLPRPAPLLTRLEIQTELVKWNSPVGSWASLLQAQLWCEQSWRYIFASSLNCFSTYSLEEEMLGQKHF